MLPFLIAEIFCPLSKFMSVPLLYPDNPAPWEYFVTEGQQLSGYKLVPQPICFKFHHFIGWGMGLGQQQILKKIKIMPPKNIN